MQHPRAGRVGPRAREPHNGAERGLKLVGVSCPAGVSATATNLGVIAVVGAHKGLTIKKQPEDGRVVVVQRRRISQWLRRLPTVLDDREMAQVVEVAGRSTTWRP